MLSLLKTFKLHAFLFICFTLFPLQEIYAYSVLPKVIDLDLERRDIVERVITIKNDTPSQVRIYPTVNEVVNNEVGEVKEFDMATNAERYVDPTSWVEVSRARITLKPGEELELPVKVHINPLAEPGEYHIFIGLVDASDKHKAKLKALSGDAQGTVLRISVEKQRSEFMRLISFMVDRIVTDTEKDTVKYEVENTGDAPITPKGEIIFYNTTGNEVGSISINEEGSIVKPGAVKDYVASTPDLSIGKYKAFLAMQYGSDNVASITDTSFFYVVPIHIMIIIFISVLVFALILTLLIHKRLSAMPDVHGAQDVSMYIRQGQSEAQDHDIDLKQQD
jgi:hypothetical protein